MKQKHIFIASAVVMLLVFVFGAFSYKTQKSEQTSRTLAQHKEALVRFHSPTIGEGNAKVHIVEFLDPACETCSEFYPLVKKMMDANPDKIKLSLRYAPFHNGSDQVVRILEAARKQGKYWQALEALLAAQPQWVVQHSARPDQVWPLLDGLGLDLERVRNDMNSPEIARIIEQDLADARSLNVTKTPEYFVNGRPLPSFGYAQLQQLVKEELAQ
jgi:protein-disulfide isomerase